MTNWIDDKMAHFPDLFNLVHPYELDFGKGRKRIATVLCGQFDALALPGLKALQIKHQCRNMRVFLSGGNKVAAALLDRALSDAVGTCEEFGEMTRLNTRLTHEDHTCP